MSPEIKLFTIIMLTHNRPAFLKEAVQALFAQTYQHLEIILLNNAGTPETVGTLRELAASDKRVKVIHFKENQYCPDDPHRIIHVCFNAGLKAAAGDYVWYQNDDDLLAPDYVEKMVRLFKGNPDCTTAAGLPVSINAEGNKIDGELRTSNFRPRYSLGHVVALDTLRGKGKLFSAPGCIFAMRRDVLIRAGGYHRAIENSHLYGIVPFGATGFDETALFYWRRHEGQLNRHLSVMGSTAFDQHFNLLREWDIERRWQVFGQDIAREVVFVIANKACFAIASGFVDNLLNGRLRASWRVFLKGRYHLYFWLAIPGVIPVYAKRVLVSRLLKPMARNLLRVWPGLSGYAPKLSRLRQGR